MTDTYCCYLCGADLTKEVVASAFDWSQGVPKGVMAFCQTCGADRWFTVEWEHVLRSVRPLAGEIKAITLWQPWATLAAYHFKKWETRGWCTDHRGLLAIHAALAFPPAARKACFVQPIYAVLSEIGYRNPDTLPRGAVLGVAALGEIQKVEDVRGKISLLESALGDYSDGRYAWRIDPCLRFAEPVECKGSQSLWLWPVPAGHVSDLITEFAGTMLGG